MYRLPTKITIGDKTYNIRDNGDYRVILDCFSALNDAELDEQERLISSLFIFYGDCKTIDDLDKLFDQNTYQKAIEEMYRFFNCGKEEIQGLKTNYKLVDWEQDETIICSAINNVAGKEVRQEAYIHWWTFMGYYMAIGESTFSTIVNIRQKIATGKKLEKYEQTFRKDNPQYFNWDFRTNEEKEITEEFMRNIWNKD